MTKSVVVVTGASGFIGSAVCIDLAKDFTVIAIDLREPSDQLRKAAPQAIWHILDICDIQGVSEVFARINKGFGQIDFVIHLAAYYDFGKKWVREYQRTNVEGTTKLIDACIREGVKRLIFASSIAAMEPLSGGSFLTEASPTSEYIPYARSKFLGERLLAEASSQLPYTILRIAGVFSDWCELPPLYSLIKLWTSGYPTGRMIPGRGESGIPYIHIHDLVRLVRKCIILYHQPGPSSIFLASQHGTVLHRELFSAIRLAAAYSGSSSPIYLPERVAKIGVRIRCVLGGFSGNMPVERPWMLNHLDKPWTIDTSITRRILDWDCTPGLDILNKIPDILSHLNADPGNWEVRNKARNARRFQYL